MESRRHFVVFFGFVALVAALGFLLVRRAKAPASVLAVVPDDAWLVLTVDVGVLRSSGLAASLASSGSAAGLGAIAGQCGFDPLARLRDIVVAAPEGGERGDFGIAFQADVSQVDLSTCAQKVIAARGGKPEAKGSRAGFQVLEDASDPGHARLAYREGGPFLVGRGEWLDRMIDRAAADGRSAASPEPGRSPKDLAPGPATHQDLRLALARAGTPTVLVTAVLPKDLRERLKAELGAELGSEADRSYAGVLSVEAAGLAMTTGPSGSTTSFDAELRCETPSACDTVKALLERKRAAFVRNVAVRLVGLGPLLDSLHVDPRGGSLAVTASAPTDDLSKALARALPFVVDSGAH